MKINEIIKNRFHLLAEKHYLPKCSNASPGTKEWLIGTEIKYGGIQTKVPRRKVSLKDPRSKDQLLCGGMIGGDRMLHHKYAAKYSEYLLPYVTKGEPLVLAEFGILTGIGLAIWCDLFKSNRVLGFDIDLSHINDNMENLLKLGAFNGTKPELLEFDQFVDNTEYLSTILKGDLIDICIDDGFHSVESILTTLKSVMPYLADNAVYFIEDNKYVHKEIRALYPNLKVDRVRDLTIVSKLGRS